MGKEWHEMTAKEIEEGFKTGAILPGAGPGEKALERLRILWRQEDSQMAKLAQKISIWVIVIGVLNLCITASGLIWAIYIAK